MKTRISFALLLMVALIATMRPAATRDTYKAEGPVPVKVVAKKGEGWQLLRGGKPYFVRGAGGSQNLELLKQAGGNSIRTWGAENAEKDLDAAYKAGLTVTLGIWLGHKGHGFKYDDPKMVAEQLAKAKEAAQKYKDHPALLAWGIGNEMEGDGKDPLVWKAVEEIARALKKIDPNHPTMTVIAELGEGGIKAKEIARLCPSIDILGVNSYGGLPSMPNRLKEAGWTKPYLVTEFGPNGPWEVPKTPWGAALEPTSTAKTLTYLTNYRNSVEAREGWCLGSYVFLWGNKYEGTATWFGMFLPGTNDKLGPVDAMTLAWTGKNPDARAPEIWHFQSSAAMTEVEPGSRHSLYCLATGGGNLTYRYEIRPDNSEKSTPEPGQVAPEAVAGVVPADSKGGNETLTAPTVPGAYRVFVYVRDGRGGAATANLPFLVKPAAK
jgi:hypothetical protein